MTSLAIKTANVTGNQNKDLFYGSGDEEHYSTTLANEYLTFVFSQPIKFNALFIQFWNGDERTYIWSGEFYNSNN